MIVFYCPLILCTMVTYHKNHKVWGEGGQIRIQSKLLVRKIRKVMYLFHLFFYLEHLGAFNERLLPRPKFLFRASSSRQAWPKQPRVTFVLFLIRVLDLLIFSVSIPAIPGFSGLLDLLSSVGMHFVNKSLTLSELRLLICLKNKSSGLAFVYISVVDEKIRAIRRPSRPFEI